MSAWRGRRDSTRTGAHPTLLSLFPLRHPFANRAPLQLATAHANNAKSSSTPLVTIRQIPGENPA